jgi:hypothetical protein
MGLKVFGYARDASDPEGPSELREVTFVAPPSVLRRIAEHLRDAADRLEREPDFDHAHLQDEWDAWGEDDADVIVAAPPPAE